MKSWKVVLAVLLALMMVSTAGWGKANKSAVTASMHDLRGASIGGVNTGFAGGATAYELCNFCHIAHKLGTSSSIAADPGYLLWNKTISSTASYGVYSSPTFNALNPTISDLGGATISTLAPSNLCLSCHDGTVAMGSFYETQLTASYQPITPSTNYTFASNGSTGTTMPTGTTVQDLTKQHPVHFQYNAALVTAYGAGLLTPASGNAVDTAGEIPLYNGYMECDTCHDPHNGASSIFERNFPTQTSGTFCTYCHM